MNNSLENNNHVLPVNIPQKNEDELKYCYRYPHAAITADCVIFGFNGKTLKILLIERGNEPYYGYWALPGGFMRMDESIEECAQRELREETNLSGVFLDQFRVYSKPNRDPRERVVTVAFIALVRPEDYNVVAGDDASKAFWFDEDMLPPLAFDHKTIIKEAREYLKEILRLKPVAFELLNKVFSISELQSVYEVINETSYDRRNFLRTAIDSEVITEVNDESDISSKRPVRLYKATVSVAEDNADSTSHPVATFSQMNFEYSDSDFSLRASYRNTEVVRNRRTEFQNREINVKRAPTKGLFDFLKKYLTPEDDSDDFI